MVQYLDWSLVSAPFNNLCLVEDLWTSGLRQVEALLKKFFFVSYSTLMAYVSSPKERIVVAASINRDMALLS